MIVGARRSRSTRKEIRDMKTLAAAFLFNTDTQMDSDPIAEMQIGTKDADYHENGCVRPPAASAVPVHVPVPVR